MASSLRFVDFSVVTQVVQNVVLKIKASPTFKAFFCSIKNILFIKRL